jgi:hypothetical protein
MKRRPRIGGGLSRIALLATACQLCVAPAVAAEDAGGRSVFATGAGNRALGLGGAFAAVADDPSAPIWNPGGLGWAERKQFAGTHSDLIGLGFSEQFVGLLLPHHRFGTFALTVRRFAVDGIERRDDRGALAGEEMTDAETELGLGYGRALGANLAVGALVKLQRQSLAGYSDSGLGLDLGLVARPLPLLGWRDDAGHLTCGFAVRNLVEPTLRLDLESVPDPSAWRGGLAWRGPLGPHLAVLVSADYEKTAGMEARLHAGAEATLFETLSLRAGSCAGVLTAGLGARRSGLGFDYQYEDNRLAAIHRFGISLAYGRTVDESRREDRLAAAAALQKELNVAFESRAREQSLAVIGQAQAALADRQWDRAIELAASLSVLDPRNDEAARLQAAAWRGRAEAEVAAGDLASAMLSFDRALAAAPADSAAAAGLTRVRLASAERADRSRELRARFEAALDAFARDDLAAAQLGFAEVLAANPDDAEATAMLARTRELSERRVAAAINDVTALLAADRLDEAAARLAAARAQVSDESRLAPLKARLEARRAALARAAAAAPALAPSTPVPAAKPVPSAARQREIAELYERGAQAYAARRVQDAIRFWEMVWGADPSYPGVAEHLVEEYLALGMDAFATGDPARAAEYWGQAVHVAPQDTRAQGYLARAREQLSTMQRLGGTR